LRSRRSLTAREGQLLAGYARCRPSKKSAVKDQRTAGNWPTPAF